jgi:G3E family GTPase
MKEPFCILQNAQDDQHDEDEWEDEDDNDSSVDEADIEMDAASADEQAKDEEAEEEEEKEETKAEILARLQAEKEALDLPARIAYKRASPVWSGVLRSKGFAWLATRPTVSGEWSQAGCMWTLNGGSPWMCAVDESMWPTDDPEVVQAIKTDFMGPWGDRRQEIVFIGQNIPQEALEKELNGALLTDKEWKDWERVSRHIANADANYGARADWQIMNSNKSEEKKVDALYNKFDGMIHLTVYMQCQS